MRYLIAGTVLASLLVLAARAEGQVFKRQPLVAAERAMMFANAGLVVIDWGQTNGFRHNGYREKNPILGPYPSRGRVNTLIGLAVVTNFAVSRIPWRAARITIWALWIVGEIEATSGNWSKQHGFSFRF
jgi:hypothetical protein